MIYVFIGLFILLLVGLVLLVIFISQKNKETKKIEENKIHTTQEQLPFVYIRRGVVKLKNGQYIKLLQVPSINTQLMEEDEKEIIRETYAGLLNSLDFKLQIYKQSRLVDINDYITFLKEKEAGVDNKFKLKGIQEYSKFVMELVKDNSIQTKKDFLVISYREDIQKAKNDTQDEMRKYRKKEEDAVDSGEESVIKEERMYEKASKILAQRENTLKKQLRRFGMYANPLDDKEAFELFYIAYNKERSVYQSLKGINPDNFTTLFVKLDKGGE